MPDHERSEQLDQAITAMLGGSSPTGSGDPAISGLLEGLLEVADPLRHLPHQSFKTRLSAELQGRTPMTAITTPAIHTILPFISVPEGGKLIDFMKHTFGAEETGRHPHGPGDGFVAVVKIGDSDVLVMGDESARGQERPAALHVYVKDCDAVYQRALSAGAVRNGPPNVGEPSDRPWGERAAFVIDPFGNHWNIATRFGPDYVPEGRGHVTPGLLPSKALPLIDFLKRAFGAEEWDRFEEGGRVVHTFLNIGQAVLELAEAEEEGLRPFGFHVYTDDVDAVYQRAVAAGATSLSPPADRPWGERAAFVMDPFGNLWFPTKHL